jgi:chemotaxis protein MotB
MSNQSGPVEIGSGEFNTLPPVRPPPLPPPTTVLPTSSSPPPPPSRKAWLVTALVGVAGVTAAFLLWTSGNEQRVRAAGAEAAQKTAEDALTAARRESGEQKATIERLERENAELLLLKQQLADDVSRLRATQDALAEKMRGEIDAGDVQVVNDNGRLRVDLIDKIVFDSGDATISKRGEEVLAKVGAVLADVDDKIIQVAGHTDDSPPTAKIKDQFPTNWELSTARATNVVRYLQEKANLKGARLVASGHGQYAPVATNANPRGRARNRRIEILLVPPLAPTKVATK